MENQMEKLPELGLNSGLRALSPGHNHYTTQPPHTHTHTHTHTHDLHTYPEQEGEFGVPVVDVSGFAIGYVH